MLDPSEEVLSEMMFKKVLATGALAGALFVAMPTAAYAQSYEFPDGSTISDVTPVAGETVDVVFDGYAPFSIVTVTQQSDPIVLGTFTADAAGVVRATVTLAPGLTGLHHIVASGTDSQGNPVSASIPITVQAPDATTNTPNGFLPRTGSNTSFIVTLGGLALAIGGAATVASRRRVAAAPTK